MFAIFGIFNDLWIFWTTLLLPFTAISCECQFSLYRNYRNVGEEKNEYENRKYQFILIVGTMAPIAQWGMGRITRARIMTFKIDSILIFFFFFLSTFDLHKFVIHQSRKRWQKVKKQLSIGFLIFVVFLILWVSNEFSKLCEKI